MRENNLQIGHLEHHWRKQEKDFYKSSTHDPKYVCHRTKSHGLLWNMNRHSHKERADWEGRCVELKWT